jgi:hypothetical protein
LEYVEYVGLGDEVRYHFSAELKAGDEPLPSGLWVQDPSWHMMFDVTPGAVSGAVCTWKYVSWAEGGGVLLGRYTPREPPDLHWADGSPVGLLETSDVRAV